MKTFDSNMTSLRETSLIKNRECKTHLKSLWIAFKMKKFLVFKVEVIRLKVLGSRARQGGEVGERVLDPTLLKGLVAFALSET